MTVPAYIINRDLIIWPKAQADHMSKVPEIEVVIVDNGSTYPPLLEWYEECPYRVVRMENVGAYVMEDRELLPWCKNALHPEATEYIITDADLSIDDVPLDFLAQLRYGMELRPDVHKVGLNLEVNDLPEDHPNYHMAHAWQDGMWLPELLHDGFYDAPVDTTFALYRTDRKGGGTMPAIRSDRPYVARHMPWYYTPATLPPDYVYYWKNAIRRYANYAQYLDAQCEKGLG